MNYALKILQDEKRLIQKCLEFWDKEKYKEPRKIREKRIREIDNAINLINTDLSK